MTAARRAGMFAAAALAGALAAAPHAAAADPAAAIDPAATTAPGRVAAFEPDLLAPGVLLFRPTGNGATHANSLVVELRDGLLVVDAQPTAAAAADLLAAIAARTTASIRYLVLTHPHVVSAGGADAFPRSAIRIASRGYRDAVADETHDFLAELRDRPGFELADGNARPLPDLVLFGRTRIEDPRQPVILLPVVEAHSPGDLVVFLPEASVVAAGDLPFPDRAPWAGSARVSGWLAQLSALMTLGPRRVCAVRGAPMDVDALRGQRNALVWLQGSVDALFSKGVDPATMPAALRADPDSGRHFAFRSEAGFDLLVARVIEETRERRRQAGLE